MEHRRRPTWRDAVVPFALLALGAIELSTLGTTGWLASVSLEALAAAFLVFRRSQPLVAVPCSAVSLMAIPFTGTEMDQAATPIFFYVLGIYSLGRYPATRGGAATAALTVGLVIVTLWFDSDGSRDWTDVVFVLSLAVPPYVFGRITRKLAEQADQLARQQEVIRDQAARQERDRIAREIHDVMAHSVSAMVVQTAAAQDLVRSDPERAAELLAAVAETGRRTLAETGQLLHLIRDESEELGLRPGPGLRDVPELVELARARGVDVDSRLDLPARPLPGGVDVSAYRVVQEALTNAGRHGDGRARLEVSADGGRLWIRCANPVGGQAGSGSGLGLQGMAERVGMLGGSLAAGPTGDGDFRVEVTIPLPEEPGRAVG